jgi:hypothetical protein
MKAMIIGIFTNFKHSRLILQGDFNVADAGGGGIHEEGTHHE